ncbi:MAG: hypothetical protein AB1422_04155 [bacterium]
MQLNLSREQIEFLPIHDAELHNLSIIQTVAGNYILLLDVEITDDSYDPGYPIPKKNGLTRIIFKNCWGIMNDLKCHCVDRDTIQGIDMIKDSNLISEMESKGIKPPIPVYHYRISLNSGSQIDVVLEEIILEG